MNSQSPYDAIYATVCRIPTGKVCTYGRVALMAGLPGHARLVGYALHALRNTGGRQVPWWRVVNASGRISNAYEPALQRELLLAEGIEFDQHDRIDLRRFLWQEAG
jgi:methylated-DNA-protein-cysteine methyltransferase related protein